MWSQQWPDPPSLTTQMANVRRVVWGYPGSEYSTGMQWISSDPAAQRDPVARGLRDLWATPHLCLALVQAEGGSRAGLGHVCENSWVVGLRVAGADSGERSGAGCLAMTHGPAACFLIPRSGCTLGAWPSPSLEWRHSQPLSQLLRGRARPSAASGRRRGWASRWPLRLDNNGLDGKSSRTAVLSAFMSTSRWLLVCFLQPCWGSPTVLGGVPFFSPHPTWQRQQRDQTAYGRGHLSWAQTPEYPIPPLLAPGLLSGERRRLFWRN